MQPLPFGRAHVLAAVGSHCAAHSVKGAAEEHRDLAGSRDGGHIDGSQSVDGGLHHHAADGGNGILQTHGQAHQAQLPHAAPVPAPVPPLHFQNGIPPHQAEQAPHPRQGLGKNRGQSRTEHIQSAGEDENHIQHDVHQRRSHQPNHRRPAVPQGAEHTRAEVVKHIGGQTHKNSLDIGVGALVNIRRGIHGGENVPAQQSRGQRHHRADGRRQPYAASHIPAQLLMVSRAELLGHRDGKAAAHAAAKTHHQKVDGAGGAHRRQRGPAQCLAHDSGVHHAVQLLEQIPKQDRDAKAQNLGHRTALCQIFCHIITSLKEDAVSFFHGRPGERLPGCLS